MLDIQGAVAVITGGSGGIGLALARHWIASGGKVVIADIDGDALGRAQEQLGDDAVTFVCDVTSEEDNGALAEFAIKQYGRINLVAPFAGIIKDGMMVSVDRESGKVTSKMPLEDFKKVIDINLTGVFLTVRECVEQMVNHECRGLVCLVSSTGSLGTAGQINYSSTKAAMSVIPKVLTAEFFRRKLADKIRCAAVAPGYVGTPMVKNMNQKALDRVLGDIPIGRLIEPEEVAVLVCDIYKNEALAGETFFINGGLRLGSRG
ncbi:SDR family NAD(P)-dependent oxidoreductase [Desulforhopalus singaporensis]|uniref:3-oxoacyl-[acyl-carrier protein] reductase n=1 Tax=Desulforhopalus singaporensis TaxID=91360 RepID=A0A1H0J259_9BACT|nr:SDR family NAD(P)-dependent oxidoreductase [Desulforhopalus singaporensis]SDO37786.1 3-oxoacyl-[acyl-carrier protein] reductase [Desulforhopalus singaporensis]